jgi:hypothetical protein
MNRLALPLICTLAVAAAPADEELLSVTPSELSKLWTRDATNVEQGIGPKDIPRDAIGCAAVGFIVEHDGRTSSVKLLRGEPAGLWTAVASKVVANLRYSPAPGNAGRQPVFTYLTVSFVGTGTQFLGSHRAPRVRVDDVALNPACAVKGMEFGTP